MKPAVADHNRHISHGQNIAGNLFGRMGEVDDPAVCDSLFNHLFTKLGEAVVTCAMQ